MSREMMRTFLFAGCVLLVTPLGVCGKSSFASYDPLVHCDEDYIPDYCDLSSALLSKMETLEDFDRCGPAVLPKVVRNYFWGTAGRGITYRANFEAYKKLTIIPNVLRDVSNSDISTTVLGTKIEIPIGLSPVALQKFANPVGEVGTALAASRVGTVMILSSLSSISIEEVAEAVRSSQGGKKLVLWMQTYLFRNSHETIQLVKRAERAGFKAIVVTVDSPSDASISCSSRNGFANMGIRLPNFSNESYDDTTLDPSITFKNLTWLKGNTKLPIVAKGILNGVVGLNILDEKRSIFGLHFKHTSVSTQQIGDDAQRAAQAGASAILVSNHGGRQLDGAPATIAVLPDVVRALKLRYPWVEVYIDGGVRSGYDVYKAISRGARAVFVGRPIVWSLAIGGEDGVYKMLDILKEEFNETMTTSGARCVTDIGESPRRLPQLPEFPRFGPHIWRGSDGRFT